MSTKAKGDFGVAMVIADAVRRGHKVALPMGENWPYDLIVLNGGKLLRVQVKYTESDGETVKVCCRSTSDWVQYKYTSEMIDYIACYDKTTGKCYYVAAGLLGKGKSILHLRLVPPKQGQKKKIRYAKDYLEF